MATDKRVGSKQPDWITRENSPGVRVDSGPFIGKIKNNADPARLGRVQVWIPDLGGREDDASNWYTISYASPFFGSTTGTSAEQIDVYGAEKQTYGFWAVPPDLDNFVLITFVMGDPSRGYWFACVPNTPVQHMVPAIARPVRNDQVIISDDFVGRTEFDSFLPVTELNMSAGDNDTRPNFATAPKLVHKYQANIVIEQGLDTDPLRGTVTSSSQRDTPSRVLGISSPGRPYPDTAEIPNFDNKLRAGEYKVGSPELLPIYRKGGHTFVMDDGDAYGDSNLVRLRTAGGHQIVMHDTANVLYISNSLGTSWIELTPDGSMNVYGSGNISLRAQKDLNLHSDANVNIHAGDTIQMHAGSTIHSQTQSHLLTAFSFYNVNAGVVGIRAGGKMNVRSISGTWECSNLFSIKANTGTWETINETSVYSKTGGWKTTAGDLKFYSQGHKIYLNTAGQIATAPVAPPQPEINPDQIMYKQTDVRKDNKTGRWLKYPDEFESIAPFTPTHEPWSRATGVRKFSDGTVDTTTPKTQSPGI